MSSNTNTIEKTDSWLGKALQMFTERLPENIATVAGGIGGYGVGEGTALGLQTLIGSTITGGILYPIIFPVFTYGGVIIGVVYSYKFAKKMLKEKEVLNCCKTTSQNNNNLEISVSPKKVNMEK